MKAVLKIALAASVCCVFGHASDAHGHHRSSDDAPTSSIQKSYKTVGVVKKIQDGGAAMNIFHEPIAELKWPSMNMKFEIKDPSASQNVKVGDKIAFEFVKEKDKYVVTKIEK